MLVYKVLFSDFRALFKEGMTKIKGACKSPSLRAYLQLFLKVNLPLELKAIITCLGVYWIMSEVPFPMMLIVCQGFLCP